MRLGDVGLERGQRGRVGGAGRVPRLLVVTRTGGAREERHEGESQLHREASSLPPPERASGRDDGHGRTPGEG
jgi:hypothetical protein